jgi:NAD(P)H-dependent nitrite reductase small subunit
MPREITVEAKALPPENGGVRLSEGDKDIALFRVGEKYFAIDNECPHYGASLADGWVDDGIVACPWHCWQFDVGNGRCLTVDGFDVKSYPVRIENGSAFVEIEE